MNKKGGGVSQIYNQKGQMVAAKLKENIMKETRIEAENLCYL